MTTPSRATLSPEGASDKALKGGIEFSLWLPNPDFRFQNSRLLTPDS